MRLYILYITFFFVEASFRNNRWPVARGAYLHIPFCRRRCFYCDFPIRVVGDGCKDDVYSSYTSILVEEIKSSVHGNDILKPLETIYFGGGTPSLLPIKDLQTILQTLKECIGIAEDCEKTLEIDPGTFDATRLSDWRRLGFNRFSLGIQSFNETVLAKSGRAHTVDDVSHALRLMNSCEDINFSIDLISGLPYLTADVWRHTLECAITSGASHISIYDLQIEDKTAFGRWYGGREGQFPLPAEDEAVYMYKLASETLAAAGYEHYEISNYALPGRRSRHNQLYWSGAATWGFGLSAASFSGRVRFSRPARFAEYSSWVERLKTEGYVTATGEGELSLGAVEDDRMDKLQDLVMLSLRTADGLDLSRVSAEFGEDVCSTILRSIQPYALDNLIAITHNGTERNLRLTDPDGFLLSNDIISSIFAELM